MNCVACQWQTGLEAQWGVGADAKASFAADALLCSGSLRVAGS